MDGVDTGVKRDQVTRMLRNTEMDHSAFAVVFSGVVKSGKSTVAKVLQHRYEMVRIENDMLRESSIELEEGEVYDVVADLVRSWDFDNKRLVLDASIDRSRSKILPALNSRGFPVYIVQMPVPEDINERFQVHYPDSDPERYIGDHEQALESLEADFVFGQDGGMRVLLRKLDRKLLQGHG